MATVYKFINNEENIEKLKKHGFKEFKEDEIVRFVKQKKVPYESKIIEMTKKFYNNQEWIKVMKDFCRIDLSQYKLTYEEIVDTDGTRAFILVETEEFKKDVVKFELYVDCNDNDILSISGKNIIYPVVLQSKEILDEAFKIEVNKLKKLGLIEEMEISEEEGE